MSKDKSEPGANVIHLHDRLTITLSPRVTKILRDETDRQAKWATEFSPAKTPEQIVEDIICLIYEPQEEYLRRSAEESERRFKKLKRKYGLI